MPIRLKHLVFTPKDVSLCHQARLLRLDFYSLMRLRTLPESSDVERVSTETARRIASSLLMRTPHKSDLSDFERQTLVVLGLAALLGETDRKG